MRTRRNLLVLGVAAALLITGCAPGPEPKPEPQPTGDASPTASAEPTPESFPEPEAAFDLTCADVAAALATVVEAPPGDVDEVLSTVSNMGWLPGPPQHMFQRAGGIACSAGETDRWWELSIAPDGPSVIAGATERDGYFGEVATCEGGYCSFEFPEGDVVLSARIQDPAVPDADAQRIEETLRGLAAEAARTVRDVEIPDSELVGAPCDLFVTTEELAELGHDVELFADYEGWGIPSEVYEVVNGSQHCLYLSSGDGEPVSRLLITSLPAGAWAFERQEGSPVAVDGADAAKESAGPHGERYVDVRVEGDWVRLTTYDDDGTGAIDPEPIAVKVVRNLTHGHVAPQ